MLRRDFLRVSATAAAACAMGDFSFAAEGGEKPNIILLVADNLGWRDLGCYGDPNAISPNTDRLAAEGVRFTNAFVTASSCSPSRSSIISGQTPHSIGALGLSHVYSKYQMPSKVPTIAKGLSMKGYNTAIDGKWHVAPFKAVSKYGYKNHLNKVEINDSNQARKFISENKANPFYLEMNFMQTHRPVPDYAYRQHPDFPVDPDKVKIQDYWRVPDWPGVREDVAAYYSQAADMDRIIGEVMEQLEADGISKNTMVIYVSDNGPMYPDGIGTCYDFGIATPLILRWPGGLPAGGVAEGIVSTSDIMPTCMEAVGISVPPVVQGSSLLPMAKGDTPELHEAIFAEMTYHVKHTPMRAVRTHDYKYIENLSPEPVGLDMCSEFEWAQRMAKLPEQRCCVDRPPVEFFDLNKDPNEMNNLADDDSLAETRAKLKAMLDRWRKETADPLIYA